MENKNKLLIAERALYLYEHYMTIGICASLIEASEHYELLNPISYMEEKEFLEENFSEVKEISVNVSNWIEEAKLICHPDFLIDRFWWKSTNREVRIVVMKTYIQRLENEINAGV